MIELTARQILNAIEGGDIESIRDDGVITILIDLKPVLTIPAEPVPQVQKTVGNAVNVLSGEVTVATIEADDEADAVLIAGAMGDILNIG